MTFTNHPDCSPLFPATHVILFLLFSAWRHWGCVTPKIITNMKKSFEEASELDGFEDLRVEDQEKITKAWEDGHVADEDIPDSARKPEGDEGDEDEEEEKPKKKKAPAKKAAKKDADEDEDEKPKKAAGRKKVSLRSWEVAYARDPPSALTSLFIMWLYSIEGC